MEPLAANNGAATETDEVALLNELRRGQPGAFDTLVRQQCGRIMTVTRRILGNEEDAKEATQDAFLNAFRGLAGFDGSARLSTWLHRIAVNAALMKLRTRQRKQDRLIDDLLPEFLEDGHQADPAVEWRDPADVALQRQETRRLVRDAIDHLPESYRVVLLMRDVEGLDTDETARMLGVTEGVVKTRLHRARQALRTLLNAQFREGAL